MELSDDCFWYILGASGSCGFPSSQSSSWAPVGSRGFWKLTPSIPCIGPVGTDCLEDWCSERSESLRWEVLRVSVDTLLAGVPGIERLFW